LIDDASRYRWEPFAPEAVRSLMEPYSGLWWIAGGWALDLWLGAPRRPHKDLDIAVLRADHRELRDLLDTWDLWFAHPDQKVAPFQILDRWEGARLDPPLHAVWARRSSEDPWFCEFLINEHHDRDWIFRGQPIERPLDSIGLIIDGLPVLCPEIVLLYKSEEPKANSADMRAAWPYLSTESSEWLKTSLRVLDARHPWLQPPRSGY